MLKRFLAFLHALMRKLRNPKPRKCRNCGNRQFAVVTECHYKAEIDGRTNEVVTDSILTEMIHAVKCTRCGKQLPDKKMQFSPVSMA